MVFLRGSLRGERLKDYLNDPCRKMVLWFVAEVAGEGSKGGKRGDVLGRGAWRMVRRWAVETGDEI